MGSHLQHELLILQQSPSSPQGPETGRCGNSPASSHLHGPVHWIPTACSGSPQPHGIGQLPLLGSQCRRGDDEAALKRARILSDLKVSRAALPPSTFLVWRGARGRQEGWKDVPALAGLGSTLSSRCWLGSSCHMLLLTPPKDGLYILFFL